VTTESSELPRKALRFASGFAGKSLLVVLGLGLGLAGSTYFIDQKVIREQVASTGDGGGFVPDAGGEGGDETGGDGAAGPRYRYETEGGEGGTAGQAGQEGSGPGTGPGDNPGQDPGDNPTNTTVPNPKNYQCADGKNGGATDDGVTGNSVKVAANFVLDGDGGSFLAEARDAVKAVLDAANVEGICGRKILLTDRNDSWDRTTGFSYIRTYINSKMFALVVNPSSEGLDQAVITGEIDKAGIPVVGSDGMIISQYRWPENSSGPGKAQWVWPVASSTVSTMHIMVEHAAKSGAKSFGLVYDNKYKFGAEGARAFENTFNRIKGSYGLTRVYTQGIEPGNTSYNDQQNVGKFNGECGTNSQPTCDLVGMLLDPATASAWIKSTGTFGKMITAGPQTLFNRNFAEDCVAIRWIELGNLSCPMVVWTGYNPPVGGLANLPGVAEYVNTVKQRKASIDPENSFTEGAYLGARLFVEALERVGPNLTRENLRAVMDSMTYDTDDVKDLTLKPLSWRASSHFANTTMQAFEISATGSNFRGWSPVSQSRTDDHWVGQI
jgi:ABC-type branched-subunit amino acid transport system substrate-binding protein